jgi:trans-aconitate methyltransferase
MKDLLDCIEPYLLEYSNQRWIELGCSPGYVSNLLFCRIPFVPFGVDFSPKANMYLETMAQHAGVHATLFQLDVREFTPSEPYDVVMSFGLVEHFSDPGEILDHHYRLCRKGGLLVIAIPHFRYLQWFYHRVFDRQDLARHNVSMMNVNTFKEFAHRHNLELLHLGYVGKINFWNVDDSGPRFIVMIRKGLSLAVRAFVNRLLSYVLPPHKKLYAPWIVFIARKV